MSTPTALNLFSKRCFSSVATETTASSASSSPRVAVVSRRWVDAHRRMNSKQSSKSNASAEKPEDKKPWPQSVLITGYSLAAVIIPYSLTWTITTNETLRTELFRRYPAVEPILRRHFGTLEWDHQPYVEVVARHEHEKIDAHYYMLKSELPFRQRIKEERIEANCLAPLKVRVCTYNDDGSLLDCSNVTTPDGTIPARRESLFQLLGKPDVLDKQQHVVVTAEFEDDDVTTTTADLAEMESSSPSAAGGGGGELLDHKLSLSQMTQVFSIWHYFQRSIQRIQGPSDYEVEVSRIEYSIAKLENDLKDPNCHRDIDDMQNELRSAKKELRNLKWKRWLG